MTGRVVQWRKRAIVSRVGGVAVMNTHWMSMKYTCSDGSYSVLRTNDKEVSVVRERKGKEVVDRQCLTCDVRGCSEFISIHHPWCCSSP